MTRYRRYLAHRKMRWAVRWKSKHHKSGQWLECTCVPCRYGFVRWLRARIPALNRLR